MNRAEAKKIAEQLRYLEREITTVRLNLSIYDAESIAEVFGYDQTEMIRRLMKKMGRLMIKLGYPFQLMLEQEKKRKPKKMVRRVIR